MWKLLLADVYPNRCSENFCNIHRKTPVFGCFCLTETPNRYFPMNIAKLVSIYNLYMATFLVVYLAPWCSGYHYCTTSLKKAWIRFCAGSNPAHGVSEIRDGEELWQWSWLEIRLNVFRPSTKIYFFPQESRRFISSDRSSHS